MGLAAACILDAVVKRPSSPDEGARCSMRQQAVSPGFYFAIFLGCASFQPCTWDEHIVGTEITPSAARRPTAFAELGTLPKNGVVRGACPHDCPDTCALHITVENGVAVKVAGDPDHPPTDGALCAKVARYTERTYHQDRLLQPLRRIGKKGQGQFEAISWDEALKTIAAKLKPIAARNPEAILPYSYAGTMGFVQSEGMAARFFHKLGASLLERTICSSAGTAGLTYTLGGKVGMDVERYAQSKLILIWGSNSITSNLHFWTFAQKAKREGARLIAIDPLRTETAEKCHQHIAIKPGTDAALALSMAHVLIENDLLDHEYIGRYTLGFEALKARAAQYPPERAAAICGIEAEVIVALALEYGRSAPAAIRLNYGMQRTRGGANAVRAVACLPALIGAWRHPSGGLLLSASHMAPERAQLTRPDLLPSWPALPRSVNMSTIGDALTEDQSIEAMIVYNSNPVAVAPDSEKVIQGFAREDLFTVVIEHFQTDTADYADIVLPATTQLEHFDLHKSYGHWYVLANEPAIAPLGQCKPNSEIFRLLAKAMGMNDPALQASDEAIAQEALDWSDSRLSGETLASVRAEGWARLKLDDAPYARGGFPTPSGRCEFYSERLQAQGLDPLPDHLDRHEEPNLAYPLSCISPPARNFMNSTFVNVDGLRARHPEQTCVIHPQDAFARGIDAGAKVRVFNECGAFEACAEISDQTRPGLVAAWGVWWHKLAQGGRNVNAVTGQKLTDLGRGPTFYDCHVEVERVG
jgi:anaerobic selenocysteine-containing dehydrogenase